MVTAVVNTYEKPTAAARRRRTPYEDAIMRYAGARLREARRAKGWSVREFEAELRRRGGVVLTFSSLANIEVGRFAVPFATLVYLAEVLGIPASQLVPPREPSRRDLVARGIYGAPESVVDLTERLIKMGEQLPRDDELGDSTN